MRQRRSHVPQGKLTRMMRVEDRDSDAAAPRGCRAMPRLPHLTPLCCGGCLEIDSGPRPRRRSESGAPTRLRTQGPRAGFQSTSLQRRCTIATVVIYPKREREL